MGHQAGPEATRADRRQLLGLDEAVEYVEAVGMPAKFLGIAQAEDAGLCRLAVQIAR